MSRLQVGSALHELLDQVGHDTYLAAYLLAPGRRDYPLEDIVVKAGCPSGVRAVRASPQPLILRTRPTGFFTGRCDGGRSYLCCRASFGRPAGARSEREACGICFVTSSCPLPRY